MKFQFMPKTFGLSQHQFDISQQQTLTCPVTPPISVTEQSTQPLLSSVQLTAPAPEAPSHDQAEVSLQEWVEEEKVLTKKPGKLRLVIILAVIGLGCAIYFIWRLPPTNSSSAPLLPSSSSANKGNSSTTTTASSGTMQVYITGAVQHPGVYTLNSDARIYQLLEAAGGPLPNANLVALNLAEKLVDGQEVYVSRIGETPPAMGSTTNNGNNQGQLVNINTASAADFQQKLHLSAKSAQDIINYRQQNGPFHSIDQLLQVVSQTIYNRIKGQITV